MREKKWAVAGGGSSSAAYPNTPRQQNGLGHPLGKLREEAKVAVVEEGARGLLDDLLPRAPGPPCFLARVGIRSQHDVKQFR